MKLEKATAIQALQDLMLKGKEKDGFYGDGKSIATIPDVPIKHSFADQLYIRQMDLKKGHVILGAVHNHLHVWFLLKGKVIINNNGEKIEHIAPCYTVSKPGSQRIILALEDAIFVNVHKNPTNNKDIAELEKEIVSMTIEEYNNKYNNI
jgi:quercetin dioxygenase-like cupin family protein